MECLLLPLIILNSYVIGCGSCDSFYLNKHVGIGPIYREAEAPENASKSLSSCSRWCHQKPSCLTHWSRVTHICVGNLAIIDSDNGLSPGRRQAITRTNVGILLIGPLGTNFSEMFSEIHIFSLKKIHLKMSSGKSGHFVSASMW